MSLNKHVYRKEKRERGAERRKEGNKKYWQSNLFYHQLNSIPAKRPLSVVLLYFEMESKGEQKSSTMTFFSCFVVCTSGDVVSLISEKRRREEK